MNAIEATIQSAGERRSEPLPPVLVEMLHEKKSIVLRVLDKGRVLDQQELDTINHFKKVNIDRMPGGGFFIAKRLTQRLLYGANVNPLNAPNNSYGLHINQNVSGKGAVVTVRLPDSIFE